MRVEGSEIGGYFGEEKKGYISFDIFSLPWWFILLLVEVSRQRFPLEENSTLEALEFYPPAKWLEASLKLLFEEGVRILPFVGSRRRPREVGLLIASILGLPSSLWEGPKGISRFVVERGAKYFRYAFMEGVKGEELRSMLKGRVVIAVSRAIRESGFGVEDHEEVGRRVVGLLGKHPWHPAYFWTNYAFFLGIDPRVRGKRVDPKMRQRAGIRIQQERQLLKVIWQQERWRRDSSPERIIAASFLIFMLGPTRTEELVAALIHTLGMPLGGRRGSLETKLPPFEMALLGKKGSIDFPVLRKWGEKIVRRVFESPGEGGHRILPELVRYQKKSEGKRLISANWRETILTFLSDFPLVSELSLIDRIGLAWWRGVLAAAMVIRTDRRSRVWERTALSEREKKQLMEIFTDSLHTVIRRGLEDQTIHPMVGDVLKSLHVVLRRIFEEEDIRVIWENVAIRLGKLGSVHENVGEELVDLLISTLKASVIEVDSLPKNWIFHKLLIQWVLEGLVDEVEGSGILEVIKKLGIAGEGEFTGTGRNRTSKDRWARIIRFQIPVTELEIEEILRRDKIPSLDILDEVLYKAYWLLEYLQECEEEKIRRDLLFPSKEWALTRIREHIAYFEERRREYYPDAPSITLSSSPSIFVGSGTFLSERERRLRSAFFLILRQLPQTEREMVIEWIQQQLIKERDKVIENIVSYIKLEICNIIGDSCKSLSPDGFSDMLRDFLLGMGEVEELEGKMGTFMVKMTSHLPSGVLEGESVSHRVEAVLRVGVEWIKEAKREYDKVMVEVIRWKGRESIDK